MFLSKDFLDDAVDSQPVPGMGAGNQAYDEAPNRPLMSSMGRPTSSYTRPHTGSTMASSYDHPGGEEPDDATPMSAAGRMQKMQQQRQRALQKQRTGASGGPTSSNMVMANSGAPTECTTPSSRAMNSRTMGRPGTAASYASSSEQPYLTQSPSPTHEDSRDSMSLNGKDMSGVIMPDPSCQDSKEDEARRRTSLAQELDDRGISAVFDPTSCGGGGAGNGGRESTFDMAAIGSTEKKSFLLNPSPKAYGMIECRIIRERTGLNKLFPKYTLESEAGVFMMTAKKQTHNKTSNYTISMVKDSNGKDTDTILGKLRSDFLGLEFIAYGAGMNPKKIDSSMSPAHAIQIARQELIAVQYSSSLWGSKPRGPRKMSVVIPRVQPSGERLVCRTLHPEVEGLLALQKQGDTRTHIDVYQNKPPKWNEQIGAFVLNFNKRVTQASVKNFQLTSQDDSDTVFLQFGRVGKDVFNMDFRFPFSPFQAFAICLSSFDYKLCCE